MHASTERRPPGPLAPETELNIASHARMDICCAGAAHFPSRQHVHGSVNLSGEHEFTPRKDRISKHASEACWTKAAMELIKRQRLD